MTTLKDIRDTYAEVLKDKPDDICYSCGQKLPADKFAENEKIRKEQKAELGKDGNNTNAKVKICTKEIAESEAEKKVLAENLIKLDAGLEELRQDKEKRFAEIDKLIENNATIPPESDKAWKIFNGRIKRSEVELGESVAVQLEHIDNQRTAKNLAVKNLNDALRHSDRMEEAKQRIAELEAKEKELAQKIADVEKQLKEIDNYKVAESSMIEAAVNSKFKHVKFTLYGEFLNGEAMPCCEALLDGKGYNEQSGGERIFAGTDIINTLSKHYDVWPCLFIDNAESLTLPIETETQVIRLVAKKGVTELEIIKDL